MLRNSLPLLSLKHDILLGSGDRLEASPSETADSLSDQESEKLRSQIDKL